jgi:hypothetical protein
VKLTLSILALFLLSAPAMAQEMQHAPANCPAEAKPLPAALSAWTDKASLDAAGDAAGLNAAALMPGKTVTASLRHTREVTYVTQPEKPGGSVAYGGLLQLNVKDAGTYQVNLSSGAWIDVLKDGAAVMSGAHAPGPACSGIRKTVQFPLQPGHYVIQLSANGDPTIAILVSRVP